MLSLSLIVVWVDGASMGIASSRVVSSLRVTNVTVAYNTIGMSLTPITGSKAAAVNVTNVLIIGGRDGDNAGCGYDGETAHCRYTPQEPSTVSFIDGWRTKMGCGGGTNTAFLNERGVVGGRVGLLGVVPHDHSNQGAYKWMPPLAPYMPWSNIRGDVVFRATVRLHDVAFVDFPRSDACGHRNWAVLMNGLSSDAHPAHVFTGVSWTNVHHDAKVCF